MRTEQSSKSFLEPQISQCQLILPSYECVCLGVGWNNLIDGSVNLKGNCGSLWCLFFFKEGRFLGGLG